MSRPWMPLYIPNYLGDTGHLSTIEHGAYLLLIMHYWQRGGLPDDDRKLACIARMSDDEFGNARATLVALFLPGWRHKRIDKELAEAETRYKRRSKAGRKGAQAKHCHQNETGNATAESCDGNAVAAPVVVLKEEQLPTKKEVVEKDKVEEGSRDTGVTRARGRPACRLPEDWQPTLADLDFAQSLLSDDQARGEADKFRDHWRAANGPPSIKRDWSAAWRNWCRKAVEINGHGQIHNGRPTRNGTGKRTVHEAAADQLEQLRALNRPAPSDLCDGAGEIPLRRISSG